MSKLSDTQAIILSAACQRPDGNLLPLPGSLRGGAAAKVVAALLARGLAEERVLDSATKADAALNTVWRNLDDGRAVLLLITAAGLEALGIGPSARLPAPCDAARRRSAGQGPPSPHRGPLSAAADSRCGHGARGHQAGGCWSRCCGAPKAPPIAEIVAGHRLAAAHGARRLRRGAEEAARAQPSRRRRSKAGSGSIASTEGEHRQSGHPTHGRARARPLSVAGRLEVQRHARRDASQCYLPAGRIAGRSRSAPELAAWPGSDAWGLIDPTGAVRVANGRSD